MKAFLPSYGAQLKSSFSLKNNIAFAITNNGIGKTNNGNHDNINGFADSINGFCGNLGSLNDEIVVPSLPIVYRLASRKNARWEVLKLIGNRVK